MGRTRVSKRECAFMKIPLEIRLMIYRPLLISKYTMKEHDMTSKEYSDNRYDIINGHDQTYEFHTAIFRTNRKINEEAKDLCRRENDFVCLTSRRFSYLGFELQNAGLQLIAKGPKAHGFWNASMTLTLDFPTSVNLPKDGFLDETKHEWICAPEDGKPWNFIICSSQLREFCRLLLEKNRWSLGPTTLHVEIDSTVQTGQATKTESTVCDHSRLDELLDPLHQLHSFKVVHVQGPLDDGYKNELMASICKDRPTPEAVVQRSMLHLDRADEQASKGHFTKANLLYKAALSSIRCCKWPWGRIPRIPTIMADGPFPGLTAFGTISNIVVRLQGRIASVYFQTGQLRMARIYTERALDPRRPVDHRYRKETYIETEDWEGVVYAEVLQVAAKISYANHNVDDALYALDLAHRCVPFDEEIERQYELLNSQSMEHFTKERERYEKRNEAREIQSRKEDKKIEGHFMVSCNRKERGDRLIQSGRSDLAALTYISALQKVGSLRQYWLEQVKFKTRRSSYWAARNPLSFLITSGPFKELNAKYATKALRLKVQACMADAYSRSGRHRDVISVVEAALDPNECYFEYEGRYWWDDQKSDYAKLHYHKALALEKLGDLSGAVEDMEKALEFDQEKDVALAELSRLKRKLEEKVAHDSRIAENLYIRRAQMESKRELKSRELRHKRATKMNLMQDRLRKKQSRRREKA